MSATNPMFRDPDDVVGRSRYHAVEPGHSVVHRIVATSDSFAPTVARLALGLVMFPHGAQKVLGWFGGHGVQGTYGFFQSLGLPGSLSMGLVFVELVCAVLLLAGAFTRIAALGIAGMMVGAAVLVHAENGFFMNWFGNQKGEGIEYFILAIGLAAVCLIAGGGKASVDRALHARRPAEGGGVGPALTNP